MTYCVRQRNCSPESHHSNFNQQHCHMLTWRPCLNSTSFASCNNSGIMYQLRDKTCPLGSTLIHGLRTFFGRSMALFTTYTQLLPSAALRLPAFVENLSSSVLLHVTLLIGHTVAMLVSFALGFSLLGACCAASSTSRRQRHADAISTPLVCMPEQQGNLQCSVLLPASSQPPKASGP